MAVDGTTGTPLALQEDSTSGKERVSTSQLVLASLLPRGSWQEREAKSTAFSREGDTFMLMAIAPMAVGACLK